MTDARKPSTGLAAVVTHDLAFQLAGAMAVSEGGYSPCLIEALDLAI